MARSINYLKKVALGSIDSDSDSFSESEETDEPVFQTSNDTEGQYPTRAESSHLVLIQDPIIRQQVRRRQVTFNPIPSL